MGLRDKMRSRVSKIRDRFSGEFSAPAPTEREDYERPGVPDEDAEVVMAQLNRPRAKRATAPKESESDS